MGKTFLASRVECDVCGSGWSVDSYDRIAEPEHSIRKLQLRWNLHPCECKSILEMKRLAMNTQ